MINSFSLNFIGTVLSPYKQKFAIPRQAGLIPEVFVTIVLNPEFTEHSVRGLDEFEYIWLQYLFHQNIEDGWSQLVRPPKLGGKIKKGVFATRSPHRPNFIGLSLLKLENIQFINGIVHLSCSGADIVDKSPVIDIKPYLAHLEAKEIRSDNFSLKQPPLLSVVWNENEKTKIKNETILNLIEKSLAQDPRPAYQKINDRIYVTEIDSYQVHFKINQRTVYIIKIILLK